MYGLVRRKKVFCGAVVETRFDKSGPCARRDKEYPFSWELLKLCSKAKHGELNHVVQRRFHSRLERLNPEPAPSIVDAKKKCQ